MNTDDGDYTYALQIYEPDPYATYSLDAAEHLAHVPRRLIALCCKRGLVSTVGDPAEGLYFDAEGIRTLRRISYLHTVRGVNLPGVKMIFELLHETEHLREEQRLTVSGNHSF